MENLNSHQWHVFWVTVLVITFALIVRLWTLIPLYTNPDLRSRTQALVQATAQREGWLLSGITINRITDDYLSVSYRSYIRGDDLITCHRIHFATGLLSSCFN